MFQHLLHKENVILGLEAPDRDSAIRRIIGQFPEWSLSTDQRLKVVERLLVRERFGTTAVGDGMAFPHTYLEGVMPMAALAVSRQGIDFAALDGAPVRFVFMLILPEGESSEQDKTRILHDAYDFFSDPLMRHRLSQANDTETVMTVLSHGALSRRILMQKSA